MTHKSGVEKSLGRGRGGFGGVEESKEGGKNGHNEKMSFVGESTRLPRAELGERLDAD